MSVHLDDISDSLQQIKPVLEKKYHVSSIGLFGSVVREDYVPYSSDVDIIVDFSQPIGIEFVDMADFIEKKLRTKVDVVSRKGIKPQYYAQIAPEIIYV